MCHRWNKRLLTLKCNTLYCQTHKRAIIHFLIGPQPFVPSSQLFLYKQIVIQVQQHQNHQLTPKFNCSEMINCFLHCNNGTIPFFPLNSETRQTLWKSAVDLMASSPLSYSLMSQDANCYGSIEASLLKTHTAVSVHGETEWGTAHTHWKQMTTMLGLTRKSGR